MAEQTRWAEEIDSLHRSSETQPAKPAPPFTQETVDAYKIECTKKKGVIATLFDGIGPAIQFLFWAALILGRLANGGC